METGGQSEGGNVISFSTREGNVREQSPPGGISVKRELYRNPYYILGIPLNATRRQIRKAYRERLQSYEALDPNDEVGRKRIQRLKNAYKLLAIQWSESGETVFPVRSGSKIQGLLSRMQKPLSRFRIRSSRQREQGKPEEPTIS